MICAKANLEIYCQLEFLMIEFKNDFTVILEMLRISNDLEIILKHLKILDIL